MSLERRARCLALYVLCLGDLMIVVDATIVNVALPSIQADLDLSQASLSWVVNGFLLTFGGFLLLGGRLGDLFGQRRMFLIGISLFTLASAACGLATSQEVLVAARAVQGLGGALVSSVALSLTFMLFSEAADRAKAMGIFGFVLSGGGALGVLLGGFLTEVDWHWIFLINLPIGLTVVLRSLRLLPGVRGTAAGGRVDVGGAITVTGALMLAVYAIVNGNNVGWGSARTLGFLAAAIALFAVFLLLESRLSQPLMPLGVFRNKSMSSANVVGMLLAAGMFAYFFFSALYIQQVLGFSPLEVGLAYLPGTIVWGAASLYSDRFVMRFGIARPLLTGLVLMGLALVLLARTPVEGNVFVDVIPATVLAGLGAGVAFNPLLLAAMSCVGPADSGLASGVVNTAFMLGGALGLATLVSLAESRTERLGGAGDIGALNGGFHAAFILGAVFLAAAALLAALLLRGVEPAAHLAQEPGPEAEPEPEPA